MTCERLPSELWFKIFKFLSTGDLVHVFHPLNNRFRSLLVDHFQRHGADLQFILQSDYYHLCQDYAPLIPSLRLCQSADYPTQTQTFLSQNLRLDQFTLLRALSLEHIESHSLWEQIMIQMDHLLDLSRLTIRSPGLSSYKKDFSLVFNRIWRLSKLAYVHLDIGWQLSTNEFPALETISTSLKCVEVESLRCRPEDLSNLLEHTPALESLSIVCGSSSTGTRSLNMFQPMRKLSLSSGIEWEFLADLLRFMPNLEDLALTATLPIAADGRQWRDLIHEYLPKLRKFRFLIHYEFQRVHHMEMQVRSLVNSFNNDFWLQRQHWCVRCDWSPLRTRDHAQLYTLPYMHNHFYECDSTADVHSLTTCTDHHSYDGVRSLDFDYSPISISSEAPPIRFTQLHSLILTLPMGTDIQTVTPTLDRLEHVTLRIERDEIDGQLLNLLNTAPRLRRLTLTQWPSSTSLGVFERLTNSSIRHLDLCGFSSTNGQQYFDQVRCQQLSRTFLATQCEVLAIRVETCDDIRYLLSSLTHLRLLVVKGMDDPYTGSLDESDEWLAWLQSCLPYSFIMFREERTFGKLRIWIE